VSEPQSIECTLHHPDGQQWLHHLMLCRNTVALTLIHGTLRQTVRRLYWVAAVQSEALSVGEPVTVLQGVHCR